MAVVTTKSTNITNRDATPRVLTDAILAGNDKRHKRAVASIANGDSVGSKYLCFTLRSDCIPISIRLTAPDIGTTTAADVGLYKTTGDGGAVVDADFFKAAVVLNAGAITKTECVNGNIITAANGEKRLWEHLGLTSDPKIDYDVVLTLTGAADAAGAVLVEADYVGA